MIQNILNNKSVWKFFLLVSYSPGEGYTRNKLKELLKWNNLSLDRTLKKLLLYKIITREKRIIKLNFSNQATEKILEIIEFEKRKLNNPQFGLLFVLTEITELLEEEEELTSAYLFGSHAKKTASVNSDIDIAVIANEKIDLTGIKETILEKFEKNIQFHVFLESEFAQKKGELIKNIIKDGVKIL